MVKVGDPVRVSPLIKFFRYSFLIAGIFYGMSKKKALEVIEGGRREDRQRLKAQRDAQIAAEKKAASENDIQQIISIFMPDEPSFTVQDQNFDMKEQSANENTSCNSVVEGIKQSIEEETDLSPLNDYSIVEGDNDCDCTYFVPQPDDVPFAAGESENFYPKDNDDDDE